ncbi:MAG: septum formation family protein [Actinomycetota bacterium]
MSLTFLLLSCALTACSSEEEEVNEFTPGIIPGALAKIGSVDSLVLEGKIVTFLYELSSEDCFNEYRLVDDRTGDISDLTTIVDCRRPHDAEIYGEHVHPADAGEPYPGRTEIERWASIKCFEGFKDFVGSDYVLSELEIGSIPPQREDWEIGLYRTAACYVYAPGSQLSGSMRGSGI